LLDNVGFDRHAKMIGLSGEVSRNVIVNSIFFERRVAEIAPENGCHSEFVRHSKSLAYFLYLPCRFFTSKIDCRAHSCSTEIPACLDGGKHDLIELIGVGEEFVVIDLNDEGYFVCILPCKESESAVSCGHCVT